MWIQRTIKSSQLQDYHTRYPHVLFEVEEYVIVDGNIPQNVVVKRFRVDFEKDISQEEIEEVVTKHLPESLELFINTEKQNKQLTVHHSHH